MCTVEHADRYWFDYKYLLTEVTKANTGGFCLHRFSFGLAEVHIAREGFLVQQRGCWRLCLGSYEGIIRGLCFGGLGDIWLLLILTSCLPELTKLNIQSTINIEIRKSNVTSTYPHAMGAPCTFFEISVTLMPGFSDLMAARLVAEK